MPETRVEEKERAIRAAIEALEAQMRLEVLEDQLHSLQRERENRRVHWPMTAQDGDITARRTATHRMDY